MSEISLANQIYIELREQILDGTIISNDIINEKSLALKYNVSKTPIREALHRLCQEGYLKKLSEESGYMVNGNQSAGLLPYPATAFYLESAAIDRVIETADDEKMEAPL